MSLAAPTIEQTGQLYVQMFTSAMNNFRLTIFLRVNKGSSLGLRIHAIRMLNFSRHDIYIYWERKLNPNF